MFKNLIAPVQAWLLAQGKCVGCGTLLSKGKKSAGKTVCKCGRIFIEENGKYRRAKMDEA